ncbi:hypothetical protein [Paenisporosarcina indica]|uniref:hypothetical protein n=1 Tax=Paenisporosarcina indica TaxID=650093 RepID=UPI0013730B57|nr:hypothetical protein [Paenisporosarcina indica]
MGSKVWVWMRQVDKNKFVPDYRARHIIHNRISIIIVPSGLATDAKQDAWSVIINELNM